MSRYIGADALKDRKFLAVQYGHKIPEQCLHYELGWNDAIDAIIENEPTADVRKNVRGEWVECGSTEHWKCKHCGERAPMVWDEENMSYAEYLSPFCPDCGAYMLGGET